MGLLKHASNVSQSALLIEEVLLRAGFPEGAFQTLLIGSDKVAGIIADRRIAAATLTGSEGAGIQVAVAASKQVKKVVLELGGSDPFIVMSSADLEEAASSAVKARVQNNGQSCIAAKRFIVDQRIADDFEKLFVKKMEALKIGDPFDETTELGPLATADGVATLDADVQKTIQAGAKLLTGGKPQSPRKFLRSHGAQQYSGWFASRLRRAFLARWLLCSAPKTSTTRFASPTPHRSDWALAPGPKTKPNKINLSRGSRPACVETFAGEFSIIAHVGEELFALAQGP